VSIGRFISPAPNHSNRLHQFEQFRFLMISVVQVLASKLEVEQI